MNRELEFSVQSEGRGKAGKCAAEGSVSCKG